MKDQQEFDDFRHSFNEGDVDIMRLWDEYVDTRAVAESRAGERDAARKHIEQALEAEQKTRATLREMREHVRKLRGAMMALADSYVVSAADAHLRETDKASRLKDLLQDVVRDSVRQFPDLADRP